MRDRGRIRSVCRSSIDLFLFCSYPEIRSTAKMDRQMGGRGRWLITRGKLHTFERPNMRLLPAALVVWLLGVAAANADCVCQCVDGQMQPLCQSSIDLPSLCAPTICPLAS